MESQWARAFVHATSIRASVPAALPDRGPQITAVAPAQLSLGVPGQTLTVFGQGLDGASVTIGGAGVDAGTPTASTGNRLDVPVQFEAGAVAGAHAMYSCSRRTATRSGAEAACRSAITR